MRVGEIVCEGVGAGEGHTEAERDLDNEGKKEGEECGVGYIENVARRGARKELGAKVAPSVTSEGVGGGFKGVDRDHDNSPADGVEDAPRRGVVFP